MIYKEYEGQPAPARPRVVYVLGDIQTKDGEVRYYSDDYDADMPQFKADQLAARQGLI